MGKWMNKEIVVRGIFVGILFFYGLASSALALDVGKSPGLTSKTVNVSEPISLYLNTTSSSQKQPVYEWLVFSAIVQGNELDLFFMQSTGEVTPFKAGMDITQYTNAFNQNADYTKIIDLTLDDLGFTAGDTLLYAYVRGFAGFELSDPTTWTLENIVVLDAISEIRPQIVQLTPLGTESISVAWLPAEFAQTKAVKYEVHVGTKDKFTPKPATLKYNTSAELQAEISGLSAGTTYYVLITAIDQNGGVLTGDDYWKVTTNKVPTEFSQDVPLVSVDEAGLQPTKVTSDLYIYSKQENPSFSPDPGTLIVGDGPQGGYLRKVVTVTDYGVDLLVQTTDATLSEAVLTGRVGNAVRLISPDNQQNNSAALQSLGNGQSTFQSIKPDGTTYSRMAWKNKLLTIEEEISPQFTPAASPGYRKIKLITHDDSDTAQLSGIDKNQITLVAQLTFEPELRTDVQWHTEWFKPVIDSGEVVAIGTFRADMSAEYEFESKYEWGTPGKPKEKQLWKRTWTSVYPLGASGILVYQEITLTLTSQAWAKASAEIDATAATFAETQIDIGIRYNPNTQKWEPVAGLNFDKGVIATLEAEGSVEGEVRLVPNLEVKFYKVVGANMTLEPYSHGLITYALDASLSGPDFWQFNNFDFLLGLDSNMNLTLWPIFDDDDPLYSAQLYSNTWPVFDLPQLSVNSSLKGDTYVLNADITNGTNNQFLDSSIEWEVFDPYGKRYSIQNGAYDGMKTAEFTPANSGKHTIILSGYGQLGKWTGEIARRYATIDIDSVVIPSLKLSADQVSVKVGDQKTVSISGGTGIYSVSSVTSKFATAVINADKVTITGVSEGTALINIEDSGGNTAKIIATVTIDNVGDSVCTLTLSSSSGDFDPNGEDKTVSITASDSSCDWSVSENLSWVTVFPSSGMGSDTVTVIVDSNSGSGLRSGTITIAGKEYTITQQGTTGPPSSSVGFIVSSTTSAYGSNHNKVCFNEFGLGWEEADWNDLENYYSSGGNMSDLISSSGFDTRKSAWVTRNGKQSYSSSRDYFASYHNHSKPGHYLAHDNIDNYFLSLGSWYGSYYVLCKYSLSQEP